ncbi:MAG: hypothetical protein KatS3mg076_2017 [Candidatus Binatia bacterium]|nr:MAG: hypothetical protein KatS3mg076_2017 [Candidatus Binatia bacterium]
MEGRALFSKLGRMDRRKFLLSLAGGFLWPLLPKRVRGALAGAALWEVRQVREGDEEELLALMRSCVATGESFHGVCREEWTRSWAEHAVRKRPASLVVELEGRIVAYCDAPSRPARSYGNPEVDRHQKAFWCGAAGVRMDLLGEELSWRVFRHLLYRVFEHARSLGYESVRAAAPWEKHPHFPKAFREYPGERVTPFIDDRGEKKYLLEWRLEDAIEALRAEGAEALV